MSLTQLVASSLTPAVVILLIFLPRLIVLITSFPFIVPIEQAEVINNIRPNAINLILGPSILHKLDRHLYLDHNRILL